MHTQAVQFIGLGGAHSGSGFLYTHLAAHPSIHLLKQPTHFFTDEKVYSKGVEWYGAHFVQAKHKGIYGEVASEYLYDSEAPERIARVVPSAKLLAVVCNPIERLYKEYEYHTAHTLAAANQTFVDFIETHPDALERGLFGKHLQRFFDLYSPLNLHVFVHEDRYNNPVHYVQSAYEFLEVDDTHFVPKPLRRFVTMDPDDLPPSPWYIRLLHLLLFPIWLFRINRLASWSWKKVRNYLPERFRRLGGSSTAVPLPQPKLLPIDDTLQSVLADYYAADVRTLSRFVQRDLNAEWGIQLSQEG